MMLANQRLTIQKQIYLTQKREVVQPLFAVITLRFFSWQS
jgi:hypothetical protein